MDDFHEGWVPATYLEPLYGSEDIAVQKLDPGEGMLYSVSMQGSFVGIWGSIHTWMHACVIICCCVKVFSIVFANGVI